MQLKRFSRRFSRRTFLQGTLAAGMTSGVARSQSPLKLGAVGGDASGRRSALSAGFDVERFVDECRITNREDTDGRAVREVLERSMADPGSVLRSLGEPLQGGIQPIYRSADLTILNIIWPPLMQLMPHEHRMWSVIGIYTGREDNIFWRENAGTIRAFSASAISVGVAEPLSRDVIHSVVNPTQKLTGAIHIYGGDFFDTPRREWDPETLMAGEWSLDRAKRLFQESTERFSLWKASADRRE